ncbi:MAG: hypothetical protein ETSY2_42045 [Candidatus Entotheonella gemina]|uniref:CCHC-type domain-containing protein n=1 Tax=Candidatus Entotheonella gemina TaxID=1429439 RepID=W4LLB1_9BACT|nr:MAG: hypothetical protein ETSY2_42045 [Candidatus Entotheonella gemina]
METAAQSMKTLKNKTEGPSTSNGSTHSQINKTSTSKSDKPVPTCYRCGIRGHTVSKCRVDKDIVCHHCQKKGHVQRACKSRKRTEEEVQVSSSSSSRPKYKTKSKSVRQVEEEKSDSDDFMTLSSV